MASIYGQGAASAAAGTNGMNGQTATPSKKHQRAYKACDHCRYSKVKCEIGDVDDPDASCARCRREERKCERRPDRSRAADGITKSRKRARKESDSNEAACTTEGAATPSESEDEEGYGETDLAFAKRLDRMSKPAIEASPESEPNAHQVINFGNLNKPALNEEERKFYAAHKIPTAAEIASAKVAWNRLYFCRADAASEPAAFTSQEAMVYVQKFYKHLAPLTPLTGLLKSYYQPFEQPELVEERPVLATALLAIASRYFEPSDYEPAVPASSARANAIHAGLCHALWEILDQVQWSTGEIGHGIHSTGATTPHAHGERSFASKLRSFSTIEALLILIEWPLRNFLGSRFANKISVMTLIQPRTIPTHVHKVQSPGGWLEHCAKNNRASWTLLSLAHNVAAELGFWEMKTHDKYANALVVLMHVMMQTFSLQYALGTSWMPTLPATSIAMMQTAAPAGGLSRNHYQADEQTADEMVAHTLLFYSELVKTTGEAFADVFKSNQAFHALMDSGNYRGVIEQHDTILEQMSDELAHRRNEILRNQRRILNLELQYYRTKILSTAVKAVGRRMTTRRNQYYGEALPSAVVGKEIAPDRNFINKLIAATLSFLETINTFAYDGSIRYLPEHVYPRIVVVCATLAKCFTMGMPTTDADRAIRLMDSAGQALVQANVDQDHVAPTVGRLILGFIDEINAVRQDFPLHSHARDGLPVPHYPDPAEQAMTQHQTPRMPFNAPVRSRASSYVGQEPVAQPLKWAGTTGGMQMGSIGNTFDGMHEDAGVYQRYGGGYGYGGSNYDFGAEYFPG